MNFRYPGGKKKSAWALASLFTSCKEFREPFAGSAAVALRVARQHPQASIWLNDLDLGISSLWESVLQDPFGLIKRVQDFHPSVEHYQEFLASLQSDEPLSGTERGFRKLALQQMSFSGLGEKAGGPIGGVSGKGKYGIGCRWSAKRLVNEIRDTHLLLKGRTRVTCLDFQVLLEVPGEGVSIYLDPPYVEVGETLYKVAFQESDHRRLAKVLRSISHEWVLSYDDHPLIRGLYEGEQIQETSWMYSIKNPKMGKELIIQPRGSERRFVSDPLGEMFGR